jgi:hypothetical protein
MSYMAVFMDALPLKRYAETLTAMDMDAWV